MNTEIKTYLQETLELAKTNVFSGKGGPFAAIIVKDGKIIASATNSVTSSNDPTAHAEVNAIREACNQLGTFQLDDCVLYSSCEPCPMCLGAIYWARPKAVYFAANRHEAASIGFDDAFIYEQIGTDPEKRHIPMQHVPIDDRFEPFKTWNENPDKTRY